MDYLQKKVLENAGICLAGGFLFTMLGLMLHWPPFLSIYFDIGLAALVSWGMWKKMDSNFMTLMAVYIAAGVIGQALSLLFYFPFLLG